MNSTDNLTLEIDKDSHFVVDNYKKPIDFIKSPFRYPGGKYYALKHIMPFIDCVPHDEFREPFVGGGSVFFGKKKSKFNWLNDLEIDLVNVYKGFSNSEIVLELEKLLRKAIATPEKHMEMKNYSPKNFIEQVFRTYYLNRTSYCGIIHKPAWGYKDGKSSPPQNWLNFVHQASAKLQNVKITSFDFEEVINSKPRGKNVLMYLDPPYYNADQKRAYTKSFEEKDHKRLCVELKRTDFLFCLSYDDCEEVRKLYSWANIYEKQWLYNTANKKGESRDLGNELVITNYEVRSHDLFS